MLAKPTNGIQEILDRFSDVEFTCEYKYDGERAQIHVLDDGRVRVFSRNCEDVTERYPDITSTFARHLGPGVRSAVFDCEAVAYDRETKKILPFQILSTRSRKAVLVEDVKIQARRLKATWRLWLPRAPIPGTCTSARRLAVAHAKR
jgi:DNA ligase-1